MNIASVPWRCGHSWIVPGSGPAASGRRAAAAGVLERDVAPLLSTDDDLAGLGQHRRAGRVDHHPPGPHRGPGRAPTSRRCSSTRRSRSSGVRRQRASGGGAARRARCTARRPARGRTMPRRQRRRRAVGGDHAGDAVGAGAAPRATSAARCCCRSMATQAGAALGGEGGEQRGLAARAGAEVEPALVAALDRRRRPARARPAASPRPAPRRGPRPPPAPRPGCRRPARTPCGEYGVGSPGSSSRVDRPGPGHQGDPGRLVVGREQRVELLGSPSAVAQLVDHPARVAVGDPATWPARSAPGPARPRRSRRRGRARRPCAARRWRSRPAPEPTRACTRSTVVLIAACVGTRIASSWWAPSRSASSTLASTLRSGRSMQAARIAS